MTYRNITAHSFTKHCSSPYRMYFNDSHMWPSKKRRW